jgi:two-component system, OmpR family, sensor histidine kinase KdpD
MHTERNRMDYQTDQTTLPLDRMRGKLKIFLGMCAGVGKTYAMLREARQKASEGVDMVIGLVETHDRPETTALLEGLQVIPLKHIEYRGIILKEMDLDAILVRKPSLVIVDELPHTNAIGIRHTKRYQDVLELLDAGIDVFTALNVQHIESRSDIVQGIAAVKVRETVPDSIIDLAEDIQLIDITPEDLRARLAEGKVYLGDRAATAADHFFRIENLSALREIAMHIMAEKIGRDVRDVMAAHHIQGPWKSSELYMVAVGPSPFSEPLIRWTRRIASATHSPWIAVHVDGFIPLTDDEKQRLSRNLSLVRQLGGETVTTAAEDVASALLQVAREKNVTQIVIGKPLESPLIRFFTRRSLVDKLILHSGDIDVTVVRAEKKTSRKNKYHGGTRMPLPLHREIGFGFGVICAITALFWLLRDVTSYSSIALLYLLSIVFLATRLNRRAIVVVAFITGIIWNFLFIPPVLTFRIGKFDDLLMFSMYIIVALVVGNLTARIRLRELSERLRESRTQVLYQLAQCVVESRSLNEGIRLAVAQIDSAFNCRTAVTLVQENGAISDTTHPASSLQLDTKELSVAAWVHGSGKPAGRFTDTLRESQGIHIPLQTTHGRVGVLSLALAEKTVLDVSQRELLETVADHVAALVDRYNLERQANKSLVAEESEKLYHVLFDCVSHELKTPLAILTAAMDQLKNALKRGDHSQTLAAQDESMIAIRRLKISVDNLLGMTLMESGHGAKGAVWCDLEEIVGSAREQLSDLLKQRRLNISIPDALPMIQADPILLTHVITNLLTNAVQYSPAGSPIDVVAAKDGEQIVFRVIDQGEGIPAEEPAARLFEKFHRGRNAKPGGIGLGLSIVRRFMELIGGAVSAENNRGGKGAMFTLTFPIRGQPSEKTP